MFNQAAPNRLINESSPYLLQHAYNPVDWYPWGDEALARAIKEDKPILLSIGYSACHWCHVMAHESFENPEIASLMNANFVNIKVDREERPDLDTIYMEAVQSISGSGGWPLTVFLTPEGKPFYGGTYFPPEEGRGLPGFPRVLETVADTYRNRRLVVDQAAQEIIDTLNRKADNPEGSGSFDLDVLDKAYSNLRKEFDDVNGGLGRAPKFPQPVVLEFILRCYCRTHHKDALDMLTLTLEKMAWGGIFDQIGGGFHRYSTDESWLVPHFEKMLYDNALLSRLYLHAYLVTGRPLFRATAESILDYVLREMTGPEGGFFSAQDADSEGREGLYYLWTYAELRRVLGSETAAKIAEYYGVTEDGNFEGANILHVASQFSQTEFEKLNQARALLLEEREKRVKPARDEKILASWNGLMLASLAEAALVFQRDDYLKAAAACGSFLLESLFSEGRLKHTFMGGMARIDAYLDDYALVIDGLLSLHQVTFEGRWLKSAIEMTHFMLENFRDESTGLFYDTDQCHQALFKRPRNIYDGAMPSGLSSAAVALLKISRITTDEHLTVTAVRSLQTVSQYLSGYPPSFGNWLCALDMYLEPPREIAFIGPRHSPVVDEFLQTIWQNWKPNCLTVALDPDDPFALSGLALLKDKNMVDGRPTVYLCQGHACRAPLTDPDLLRKQLGKDVESRMLNVTEDVE
ncbi:MAG: thioredoxin domain-containing protein [Deltaproteobacteria bacterium]|nr:thioredoxin domain-containing protein [Deltaproteobacteria bacterium]